jgi:hypothetical protein
MVPQLYVLCVLKDEQLAPSTLKRTAMVYLNNRRRFTNKQLLAYGAALDTPQVLDLFLVKKTFIQRMKLLDEIVKPNREA